MFMIELLAIFRYVFKSIGMDTPILVILILVLFIAAVVGIISTVNGACSWVRARRGTRVVSHDNVWCAAVPATGRVS